MGPPDLCYILGFATGGGNGAEMGNTDVPPRANAGRPFRTDCAVNVWGKGNVREQQL